MPELVVNGPNIPTKLLNALDDGRVVFFCGAGISVPTGLPDFMGLFDQVVQQCHLTLQPEEREALDQVSGLPEKLRRPKFDKAFGLLERKNRLSPDKLRQAVRDALSKPCDNSDTLRVHCALLRLARGDSGIRLVTTNFDRRFEEADKHLQPHMVHAAPRLPIPKRSSWRSLVHLHGKIDDNNAPSDLVLTAADFGRAYLTERWASRFVTELFREHIVVFVGYSLNDPVMAYMVDALAAERARGESFEEAYAFADFDGLPGDREDNERAWCAKGVTPIMFDRQEDYRLLGDTLIEWARIVEDPFQSRLSIAIDAIGKLPETEDDPLVERTVWALSDPAVARAFAAQCQVNDSADFPKIPRWLRAFVKGGLLGRATELPSGPLNRLCGAAATASPLDLAPVGLALARWIAGHLHVPQVLTWVAESGDGIHPMFQRFIQQQLAKSDYELNQDLRKYWTALAFGDVRGLSSTTYGKLALLDGRTAQAAPLSVQQQLLWMIRPRLLVRPGPSAKDRWNLLDPETGAQSGEGAAAHFELSIGMDDEVYLACKMLEDDALLCSSLEAITSLLEQAISLSHHDRDISNEWTSLLLPSISEHGQNRVADLDNWVALVVLLRDGYRSLSSKNANAASALLGRWARNSHNFFRRLALHAVTDDPNADIMVAARILLRGDSGDGIGLWNLDLNRETLRFLRLSAHRLPPGQLEQLVGELQEPGRLGEVKHKNSAKAGRPGRVRKLLQSVPALSEQLHDIAKTDIGTIAPTQPDRVQNERDEFLHWVGEATWVENGSQYPDIRDWRSVDIATRLSDGTIKPEQFERLATSRPIKALVVLRRLPLTEGNLDRLASYWESLFWALRFDGNKETAPSRKRAECVWGLVRPVLLAAPSEFFRNVKTGLAEHLRHLAMMLDESHEQDYGAIWLRKWEGVSSNYHAPDERVADRAINAAEGKLAEAALERLKLRRPGVGDGIPEPTVGYFDVICEAQTGHLARVILAMHLNYLYAVDSDWTNKHLLSRLEKIDTDEALDLWTAFAWSPSVSPNLFAAFTSAFLNALMRYNNIGVSRDNLVALLVLASTQPELPLTEAQVVEAINMLPNEALPVILGQLGRSLSGPADDRRKAWREVLVPWLNRFWPVAGAHQTAEVSEAWVNLLEETGSAFPDAVEWAHEQLTAVEVRGLFSIVRNHDLASEYPANWIKLVSRIWPPGEVDRLITQSLSEALNRIAEQHGQIAQRQEFRDLVARTR